MKDVRGEDIEPSDWIAYGSKRGLKTGQVAEIAWNVRGCRVKVWTGHDHVVLHNLRNIVVCSK